MKLVWHPDSSDGSVYARFDVFGATVYATVGRVGEAAFDVWEATVGADAHYGKRVHLGEGIDKAKAAAQTYVDDIFAALAVACSDTSTK